MNGDDKKNASHRLSSRLVQAAFLAMVPALVSGHDQVGRQPHIAA